MKHTIRGKYTLLIAGLMGVMILIICLANSLYLEKFYISEKNRDMVDVYAEIDAILEDGSLVDSGTQDKLWRLFTRTNISAAVVVNAEESASFTFGDAKRIQEQMGELIYGEGLESATLVEQAERYVSCRWYDKELRTGYILLFGFLEHGGLCFLRSALPGIQEGAEISTRFSWMIGITLIVIGIFLVSVVSSRISRPIVRLSHIADRMAHLDFSVRYEEEREDEIGLLGTSMNHMSDALESTIQNLRQANEQLQKDIEEKVKVDEMRKDFISNVSHELKTPIALIQGYAEGLLDGISDDPDSMRYYCEVIVDEAGKMNQLVRRLLTLNQIESGINTVEPVDFDLIPVIEGVLHSFNIMLQQKNITVEFDSKKELIVRADEFMMEEVVRNYISNAVNHIGGDRQIKIWTEETPERVRVSVFNTGNSIPDEALEKVWQKFYKVDKAHTREYGGSGIGLSIVKAVMDSHGGSCGVCNTGDGVCFWFELTKLELPALIHDGQKQNALI